MATQIAALPLKSSQSLGNLVSFSDESEQSPPSTQEEVEEVARNTGSLPPLELLRTKSCPVGPKQFEECREFDNFAGEWTDSKGQTVLISPWGVIRYPNNPKLRFEAIYMGPNHLSVTFDKDPKRRKFVGKLNHDCELLIWSNDTKWTKKGSKSDFRINSSPEQSSSKSPSSSPKAGKGRSNNTSCLIQ